MLVTTTLCTTHTYGPHPGLPERISLAKLSARLMRVVPYVVISTGMLAHQMCAYLEGIWSLGGEFERTPKEGDKANESAATRAAKKQRSKVHGCLFIEVLFIIYQMYWAYYFYLHSPQRDARCQGEHPHSACPGPVLAALPCIFSSYVGLCMATVFYFYGDDRPDSLPSRLFARTRTSGNRDRDLDLERPLIKNGSDLEADGRKSPRPDGKSPRCRHSVLAGAEDFIDIMENRGSTPNCISPSSTWSSELQSSEDGSNNNPNDIHSWDSPAFPAVWTTPSGPTVSASTSERAY